MAKVVINIPGKPPKRDRQYTLNLAIFNEDDKPADNVVLKFTSRKLLHKGNSHVYLGRLECGSAVYPLDAVCKLVLGDTSLLQAEAKLYTTALKSVQGFLVPHFLDCYTGISPYSNKAAACILMSYGGKPLRGEWVDAPIEMRNKVMDELVRIHRLGVIHGEFNPRHVVVDSKGHPRIIDFDHAELHECRAAHRTYKLYELEPPQSEVNCVEIYEAATEMDIWTPVTCSFMGFTIDMRKIKGVDDLIKLALERRPWHDLEDIKKEAVRFLTSYSNHYLDRKAAARKAKKALRAQSSDQSSASSGSPVHPSGDSGSAHTLPTQKPEVEQSPSDESDKSY